MKIAIIGNAGSGKSTLAQQLSELLGLPIYHLDQYYWGHTWHRPDPDVFRATHNQLCDKNSWIIEGIATKLFDYRAEQADIVIFLDMSIYRCLYRVLKRAFLLFGKVRPDSAPGCPERFPDYTFLKFIVTFNWLRAPIIRDILHKHSSHKRCFTIRNQAEWNSLMLTLAEK